jgi:hypothetical protein
VTAALHGKYGPDVADWLDGLALPANERPQAVQNALRLLDDLESAGLRVLVLHNLESFAALFKRQGWNLARNLNPRWWPHDSTPQRSLLLVAESNQGIAQISAMRWIWLDGSLREMHENGRFFYGDYADLAADRVRVRVNAPIADHIAHCAVVYSCGWRSEDMRGNTFTARRCVRLAQILAAINWHFSWLIARTDRRKAQAFAEDAFGMSTIESGIYVRRPDETVEKEYHLIAGRIDHMRRQFQKPEYGDGAQSLGGGLPLFGWGE